jgi:hypothetical protein
MRYQLYFYKAFDGSDKVLIATSEVLTTESDCKDWYDSVVLTNPPPEGYTSTVVDQNHGWFEFKPTTVEVSKEETLESLQAELASYTDDVVPQDLVIRISKLRMLKERQDRFDYDQRYAEYMANFEG